VSTHTLRAGQALWIFALLHACGAKDSPKDYLEPESTPERHQFLLRQCENSTESFCLETQLLLDAVQQERSLKMLKPMARDPELDDLALSWACAEDNRTKIDHGDWQNRQGKAGFVPGGENLLRLAGSDFNSERMRRAIALWRASPTHYAQWVQPDNKLFGVAICVQNGGVVLAHEFAFGRTPQ
jgi:uncharacterized protein YkwD